MYNKWSINISMYIIYTFLHKTIFYTIKNLDAGGVVAGWMGFRIAGVCNFATCIQFGLVTKKYINAFITNV